MNRLPLMPGTNELIHCDLLRTDYRKAQALKAVETGKEGARRDVDTFVLREGSYADALPPPAFLVLDKKVLKFDAYFQEGVHESQVENSRVRRCVIQYFLEDDTMAVVEQRQVNSGMSQGCLLKRHRFPRTGMQGHIDWKDLRLGSEIDIYGKVFRITDCDQFTRQFAEEHGVDIGMPEEVPVDAHTLARSRPTKRPGLRAEDFKLSIGKTGAAGGSTATREEVMTTTQFLQNDRKVLKFHAVWDDRRNLNGDYRYFTVYFFLADGCMEIVENYTANNGRDPFPSFVRRMKVPKHDASKKYESINSSLLFKSDVQRYWTAEDLYVGAEITVFGRTFKLYKCDEFTREYLMTVHHVPSSKLQPQDMTLRKRPTPKPEPPPHNGFGDEEDSLKSWKELAVKSRVKSTKRFIEIGNDSLKFSLRLDADDPCNSLRRFVLTYYMADGTVAIFEPAIRNSGILGGRFLHRQKIKVDGRYATPQDFYVGARLCINSHQFIVLSTDERTLAYMEQNSSQFPRANINTVLDKLRAMLLSKKTGLREAFEKADTDRSGKLNYMEFCSIVESLGLPIVEQEILCIMRKFDLDNDGEISYSEFMRRIMPEEPDVPEEAAWQEITQKWDKEKELHEAIHEGELVRQKEYLERNAAQGMLKILQFYKTRKTLFDQELKVACDMSADALLGEPEFRRMIRKRLKIEMSDKHLDELCRALFPEKLPRMPHSEMIRLLQNTSNYPHTAKTIARLR